MRAPIMQWSTDVSVYLHAQPVDFRKAINGLSELVEDAMGLSAFERALFVFCNKNRSQLKVLYWDCTGFVLWQKRLEEDKFTWSRTLNEVTLSITSEQWGWLLQGVNWTQIKAHKSLDYQATG